VLDFSFKLEELKQFPKESNVIILDHHKTARENLMVHDGEGWINHPDLPENISLGFDMCASGCELAWEYFNTYNPTPTMLQLIGMRDLWLHKGTCYEKDAEALNLFLGSREEKSFEVWEEYNSDIFVCIDTGRELLSMFEKNVKNALLGVQGKWYMCQDGTTRWFRAGICNAPYSLASEVGNRICSELGFDFAVVWSVGSDGKVNISLRSVGDKVDVSDIAKRYGGGGHKNAAGFKLDDLYSFARECYL
jgi:oligoribonuclease NrnB/cAMP/cGMP phosphodiesterase (DHH superfamily)